MKEVKITLDRERTMCLRQRQIREFGRLTGLSLTDALMFPKLTPDQFAILIHQSLLRDDPALTLDDLDDIIGAEDMEAIFTALGELFGAPLAEKPTGSDDGPSADTISDSETLS